MYIYYSGLEAASRLNRLIEMVDKGFKIGGVLVSYLHITPTTVERLKILKEKGVRLFLDSGAHSFLYYHFKKTGSQKDMGHEVSQQVIDIVENNKIDIYVNGLIDFVEKNKDLFDVYVELDIQPMVGDKVNEWRTQWKAKGLTPMYVWHGEQLEQVKEWLLNTDKIGLGGTGKDGDMDRRLNIGRQIKQLNPNVSIHGFAMTGAEDMKKGKDFLTSVDSTSWLSFSRFGLFYTCVGNNFGPSQKDDKQSLGRMVMIYQKEFERIGIDIDKIKILDTDEMDWMNLFMFEKYANNLSGGLLNIHERGTQVLAPKSPAGWRLNGLKTGKYAKKLRGQFCNWCPISAKCPEYVPDAVCAYTKAWSKFTPFRDTTQVAEALEKIIKDESFRYERARTFEDVEGGYLDKQVSNLGERLAKHISMYNQVKNPQSIVNLTQETNIVNLTQLLANMPEKYNEVMEKWKVYRAKKEN